MPNQKRYIQRQFRQIGKTLKTKEISY
jgi:hypothetical protein